MTDIGATPSPRCVAAKTAFHPEPTPAQVTKRRIFPLPQKGQQAHNVSIIVAKMMPSAVPCSSRRASAVAQAAFR
jgi:hypothetical protein